MYEQYSRLKFVRSVTLSLSLSGIFLFHLGTYETPYADVLKRKSLIYKKIFDFIHFDGGSTFPEWINVRRPTMFDQTFTYFPPHSAMTPFNGHLMNFSDFM